MNKQVVELLFIKSWTDIEHQILQIITQYINYKLSIDYESELLLYNLDLLMAPFTYEARSYKGTWFNCYLWLLPFKVLLSLSGFSCKAS